MMDSLVVSLAQLNPTVGDIDGNLDHVRAALAEARRQGADLLVCGELVVAGYPPEDLVLKQAFQDRIEEAVTSFASETLGGPAVLLGCPWRGAGMLYNAALLIADGRIAEIRFKHALPNYGVFDEVRVFSAGPLPQPIMFRGVPLGVMVCEDMWGGEVARHLADQGAEIFVVLNGSPFEVDKTGLRLEMARDRINECGLPLIYVNLVGGQDELVFDGSSFVAGAEGDLRAHAASWRTQVARTAWRRGDNNTWVCTEGPAETPAEGLEAIYRAITMGLRDYVEKNGFPGVVLGMSGGIDSALSAAVAVDALGPERVHCIMMPSPYTSPESLEDAAAAAATMGARLDTVSIEPAMRAFESMLADIFAGLPAGIAEENIQARARGLTLMALSNKLGHMLLTTGNKSEVSVGYATLYGDMCGGYSVLSDVYKTTVFALARWRNQARVANLLGPQGRVMPERIITKPPSAELKPGQTDQDTLPPYDELDAVLNCLVEEELSVDETVQRGHSRDVVRRIWRMLDRAEYKRRQAAPGVKITPRSFGRDRRYPLTNRFTDLV
jgi:NAD+ synthase